MTKATLLIMASLAAAALLAAACGGSAVGRKTARLSDPERQERQSDTPEATAVPGETPSGPSRVLGRDGGVELEPAGVSFASVSAGDGHTYGVTASGDALCWGLP